ncbi:tRNA (adenosine(37)-N6)-threonylcarbamoyltransferase complex ATPase subunit type 1 TsaE [Myceligenerans salitolerans]|uniref:tRNA threonylcarbamoyladenosine biosynthesis protein TsaE n=1 Tax=Myceligenerans salitolerans TaxID=1230528 RepID=A0ABS3I997_9MICO|nr:tRNA (adenosine(37)-N6)-threonylcarbamoyltransferase complex ATPase subunit type 1 TsaE [Myceligenerans salitolerans]MBO0608642.1 tRNA (adenosine(37)-N6)-threonylcarbamoyltransferase complex ATPase subunit type 1 TsaE [Myceligenerans salitolerans]
MNGTTQDEGVAAAVREAIRAVGTGAGPVTLELPDAGATRAFGAQLAGLVRAGDLVILTGDLGAGKTTLTQGLGSGLHVRGQVASPTFIIAREHPPLPREDGTRGPALVHVDAYRLGGLDELDALDLDSSLDESVTVVEWGRGLAEALTEDRLEIDLVRPRGGEPDPDDPDSGVRRATIRAVGERWARLPL